MGGGYGSIDSKMQPRSIPAIEVYAAHLTTCDACNYDKECTACAASPYEGEKDSDHACNCKINGTGARLRANSEQARLAVNKAIQHRTQLR